jgi:hypothetical protein
MDISEQPVAYTGKKTTFSEMVVKIKIPAAYLAL